MNNNLTRALGSLNLTDAVANTTDYSGNVDGDGNSAYITKECLDGFQAFFAPVELCRRLSPPPIPPWLRDSPDRLRQMVANCSSWKKYMELCSSEVPPEYLHAQAILDTDVAAVQWIPTAIVLLMAMIMIVGAGVVYLLYKMKRINVVTLNKCLECTQCSWIFKHQQDLLTKGASRYNQVSVCAVTDDQFWSITPYQLTASGQDHTELRKTASSIESELYSLQDSPACISGELILHPERLIDSDEQSSLCTSSLAGSCYSLSHSLPIVPGRGKSEASTSQQNYGSFAFGLDESGCDAAYFQLSNGKHKKQSCAHLGRNFVKRIENFSYRINKDNVKMVIENCQIAGASLIHVVARKRFLDPAAFQRIKFPFNLMKFRQSAHKFRTSRQHFYQTYERLQRYTPSINTLLLSDPEIPSACYPAGSESNTLLNQSTNTINGTSYTFNGRLRHAGHLLHHGHKGKLKIRKINGYRC